MKESWKTKLKRWRFNCIPCYWGTGAHVSYLSNDFREIQVTLPLNWRTRNYVGTTFGGSIYGALDPIYMLMLIKNLGPEYIVWDKTATVHFKKPGRTALCAKFLLTAKELSDIQDELTRSRSIERKYLVDLIDDRNVVHASVEKVIYIRKRGNSKSP